MTDRDDLLRLHELERRAHLDGDADVLASSMAEEIWEAGRGGLTIASKADIRNRFAAYFETVRYSVWDDLIQPHVAVSRDGQHGWMAVHIEAELSPKDGAEPSRRFESSWISVYEKRDDRWLMVGISSSVVDRA